jgi:hypothetical protein
VFAKNQLPVFPPFPSILFTDGAVSSNEEYFVNRNVPYFFKIENLSTLMAKSDPLIFLLHHPQHPDFVAAQRRCAAFLSINLKNSNRFIATMSQ